VRAFDVISSMARSHLTEPAVEHGGRGQTFGDLLRAASAVAGLVYRAGAREGDLVGLLLARDLRLPVAMLASLQLGTTFVPLSEKYPRERWASLIRRHAIRYVITSPELAPGLPDDTTPILLRDATSFHGVEAPGPARGQAPPYVIFTSGSTGEPKGVIIREAALLNLITWAVEQYSPEDRRSVLASTPITFDLSIFEILATLAAGGRIVLVDSILDLLSWPGDLDVSLINTVPSAAKELVRFRRFPRATRVVNLAGEALHQDLVDAIYEAAPEVEKVFNLYGPSEDTTYSTWHLARRGAKATAVPIGRPLPGKHAHLLDEHRIPMPEGTPGEICLSGAGLSAGYLDDPVLTAKKFVTVTAGPLAGERIYCTGDIGSRDASGELTYLGRVDRQVKVRGVRIEPGEIESALRSIAGVEDAAVHKAIDTHGNDHLLAFVTHRDNGSPAPEILEALRVKLPEFMIPSRVEILSSIPLTANGKVDHHRLEAISRELLNL
jgi:amino acid adenylation domain-containing protein